MRNIVKHAFVALLGFSACQSVPAIAADSPCPQIDQTVKDTDGMAFCPSVVTETSAYGVFRCALEEARSWHALKKDERGTMVDLLQAWKANRSGITKEHTAALLAAADNLKLQACRVRDKEDSYVLVYTKPKVSDYSGPLLMLRETKASKFVIISPHDDSDGTFADTKKAFQHSSALAMISNGHKRGNVTANAEHCGNERQSGDMVHQPEGCNLGTATIFALTNMMNGDGEMGTIMLHIHGMSNPKSVIYRDRDNKQLSAAWEKAVKASTNIENFGPLNADFSIDPVKGAMLKTEIPARIHTNGEMMALARIVNNLEGNPWAWPEEKKAALEDETQSGDELAALDEDDFENDKDVPAPAASPGPWTPPKKIRTGKQDLICVAIQYTSGPSAEEGRCLQLAHNVADFWDRQSVGKMKLIPKAISYAFDGPAGGPSAAKVHDIMRKKYPDALFLVPNLWYHGSSHAGQRVAVLTGYSNADHETGHLLGLGHCGAYKPDGTFDQYGGGGCIMSKFFGNAFLAPSQYIYLGWYDQTQYAVQTTTETKQYEIRAISALKSPGLGAIAIAPDLLGGGRAGYIGWPPNCQNDPCLAFYYATGGGSQRVKIFGKEFFDEKTGLRIKGLGAAAGKQKIEVSFEKLAVHKP